MFFLFLIPEFSLSVFSVLSVVKSFIPSILLKKPSVFLYVLYGLFFLFLISLYFLSVLSVCSVVNYLNLF